MQENIIIIIFNIIGNTTLLFQFYFNLLLWLNSSYNLLLFY